MTCEPGDYFIDLYIDVERATPGERTVCGALPAGQLQAIAKLMEISDGAELVQELRSMLAGIPATNSKSVLAMKLAILQKLDEAFLSIHPRSKRSPLGKSKPRPDWLAQALSSWYDQGFYLERHDRRLLPRGPLLKAARHELDSSGNTLEDKFTALSVTGQSLEERGRPIPITHLVISAGGTRGVATGSRPTHEKVAFLAVGQDDMDIEISYREANSVGYLDFRAAANLDVPARVMAGLAATGDADIVLAPELLICEEHADCICGQMATMDNLPRMFVIGSGHTREVNADSMAWNETRVVNQYGAELWRQRKVWQAFTEGTRGRQLGLTIDEHQQYSEFNASGSELIIADVESIGRCVVLICQDLTAQPLLGELVRKYQPDWVLVPIMDRDVSDGRWAHQYAYGVSDRSRARFLMSTNTSYAKRIGWTDPVVMGLALGPMAPDSDEAGRLCAALTPEAGAAVDIAVVEWGSGCSKWKVSKLGI